MAPDKKNGRKAFENDEETKYLNKDKLEKDLIDLPDPEEGDHGQIVDSEHSPENQEWNAREKQNRDESNVQHD